MISRSFFRFVGCSLLVCIVSSCSKPLPEDLNKLKDMADDVLKEAKTASEDTDGKAAKKVVKRARAILQKAEEVAKVDTDKNGDSEANDTKVLGAIRKTVRKAIYHGELAEEKYERKSALNSLKAKAYRSVRKLSYEYGLIGLEKVALQMEKCRKDPKLAKPSAELQELALSLTECLKQGQYRKPDGTFDWKLVAANLKAVRTSPPPPLYQFLSLAYLIAGQNELALYEIELLAKNPYKANTDESALFYIQKSIIYTWLNWKHLAVLEIGKLKNDRIGGSGEERIAMIHLFLAVFFTYQKEYEKADAEIVRLMQICPNHPITVLLTGERLAAEGKSEEAADVLDRVVDEIIKDESINDDWFVKKVRARAKKLRDGKSEGQCLFYDKVFITEVLLKHIWIKVKSVDYAAKIKEQVNVAKTYSKVYLTKLKTMVKVEDLKGIVKEPTTEPETSQPESEN